MRRKAPYNTDGDELRDCPIPVFGMLCSVLLYLPRYCCNRAPLKPRDPLGMDEDFLRYIVCRCFGLLLILVAGIFCIVGASNYTYALEEKAAFEKLCAGFPTPKACLEEPPPKPFRAGGAELIIFGVLSLFGILCCVNCLRHLYLPAAAKAQEPVYAPASAAEAKADEQAGAPASAAEAKAGAQTGPQAEAQRTVNSPTDSSSGGIPAEAYVAIKSLHVEGDLKQAERDHATSQAEVQTEADASHVRLQEKLAARKAGGGGNNQV